MRGSAGVLFIAGLVAGCGASELMIRDPMLDGSALGACGAGCESPPPNRCEGASMLRVFSPTGSCEAQGCTYGSSITSCPRGCYASACIGDPCLGISCQAPPQPSCTDAGLLLVTKGPGFCKAGTCEYVVSSEVTCPDAGICVDGACETDPCLGVDCSNPPAQVCADSQTVSVPISGVCRNGRCQWTNARSRCSFGCVDDDCAPDPCAGVVCDMPPAPVCVGTSISRTWPTATCSRGTCVYTQQNSVCARGCVAGLCATADAGADAGRPDAGPGRLDGGLDGGSDAGLAPDASWDGGAQVDAGPSAFDAGADAGDGGVPDAG